MKGVPPVEEATGLSAEQLRRLDLLCDEFESGWRAGQAPRIEDFLSRVDAPLRLPLLADLIRTEVEWKSERGAPVSLGDYEKRFSECAGFLPGWLDTARSDAIPGVTSWDTAFPEQGNLPSTPERPVAPAPAPPLRQLGEYDLLGLIGQGGMGKVFEGRHRRLGKRVAVKLLSGRLGQDLAAMERFRREMAAVGQLEHPNLVVAHDAGEQDGVAYLVLEYIPGIDLHQLVKEKGPLPVEQACDLVRQAALGVQYLHEHGLVHRDIKPGNMMLLPDGRLKVLDLGLARRRAPGKENEEQLTVGFLGTPDFMSPEQALNSTDAGPGTDLYALGCSLFYLLTGKAPFAHHSGLQEKNQAHAGEAPPDIRAIRPEVPARVAALVSRLLAKRPEERCCSARDLAEELERIQRKPGRWRWLGAASQHHRRRLAAGAAMACMLAALLVWGSHRSNPSGELSYPGEIKPVVIRPAPGEVVTHFDVRHLAREGEGVRPRGVLGVNSFATRLQDFVTIDVALAEPAYCFLIAFCPDGTDRLCFPATKTEPPALSAHPGYPPPEKSGKAYGLKEGEGLQAFFLVVSRKPLPAYDEWKKTRGGFPWTKEKALAGVLWRYDGRHLKLYSFDDPGGRSRGEDEDLPGSGPLVRLIENLSAAPDVEVVCGVAFAVLPREMP